MRIPIGLAAIAVLSFGSCTAPFEGATPTPQRPTISSDTKLTAPGTIELESGVAFEASESFDTPKTLKLGLTWNLGGIPMASRGEGVQP